MKILISALFILMLVRCEERVQPVRTFIIKQAEHYSSVRIVETLQQNTLEFEAMFDQTAVYHFADTSLQTNKNKLMGFADCNSMHHENSARFAWMWYKCNLEIYAYCYVNKERVEKYIGKVDLNVFNRYTIEIKPTEYIFTLNDHKPVVISRGTVCDKGMYYKLWPYFGGGVPAPHDIKIQVRSIF